MVTCTLKMTKQGGVLDVNLIRWDLVETMSSALSDGRLWPLSSVIRTFQAEGAASANALQWDGAWDVIRNRKEGTVAEYRGQEWGQTCWSCPDTLSTEDRAQYPPRTGAWSGCSNSRMDASEGLPPVARRGGPCPVLWLGCTLGIGPLPALSVFEHRIGKILLCCCGSACGYCRDGRDSCVTWGWALTGHDVYMRLSIKLSSVATHYCELAWCNWSKVYFAECSWYSNVQVDFVHIVHVHLWVLAVIYFCTQTWACTGSR